MHACDVIAYVGDGEILCDSCGTDSDDPIFADSDLRAGETCGSCGAVYLPDDTWSAARDTEDYRADLETLRWAVCERCNTHVAHWRTDDRARLTARRNQLGCPSCYHGRLHF